MFSDCSTREDVSKKKMKLCVVGAGAAGLCAIKHAADFGCQVIAFEQTHKVGGTWVYTDAVGKDKNGLDIHSSMYKGLFTNSPKEIMGYPDVPFDSDKESYIASDKVLNYYKSYADQFNLHQFIKFEHHVIRVRPIAEDRWEVIVKDLINKKYETHTFDAILICNGHFNHPNVPMIKGQKTFNGRQMHSHDYRSPENFKDKNVLIIGAGPSGMDITLDISKLAHSVIWSHHLEKPPALPLGDNVKQKSDVMEITEKGAFFNDNTYQDFNIIVYCTGYKYTFPFLSVDCGITVKENYISPLFKHCLNINHPTMGLLGLPNAICPNQMFDLQARFCLTFMMKRKVFPTKDEMLQRLARDEADRNERGFGNKKGHILGPDLHEEYCASLADIAEIEPIKPVINKMFAKCIFNLINHTAVFREDIYEVINDDNFIVTRK